MGDGIFGCMIDNATAKEKIVKMKVSKRANIPPESKLLASISLFFGKEEFWMCGIHLTMSEKGFSIVYGIAQFKNINSTGNGRRHAPKVSLGRSLSQLQ